MWMDFARPLFALQLFATRRSRSRAGHVSGQHVMRERRGSAYGYRIDARMLLEIIAPLIES